MVPESSLNLIILWIENQKKKKNCRLLKILYATSVLQDTRSNVYFYVNNNNLVIECNTCHLCVLKKT